MELSSFIQRVVEMCFIYGKRADICTWEKVVELKLNICIFHHHTLFILVRTTVNGGSDNTTEWILIARGMLGVFRVPHCCSFGTMSLISICP